MAAIFDSSGNLIGQQVIDYLGTADGDERESFIGLRSTLQNISYAVFFVGSTNATSTAFNSRQNSYAFGGFTFLTSELVPEPSVVVGVSLAALLVGVAVYRRRRAVRTSA